MSIVYYLLPYFTVMSSPLNHLPLISLMVPSANISSRVCIDLLTQHIGILVESDAHGLSTQGRSYKGEGVSTFELADRIESDNPIGEHTVNTTV